MRVLGVDPGLTRCGVGIVDGAPGRSLTLVDVTVIPMDRLAEIETVGDLVRILSRIDTAAGGG